MGGMNENWLILHNRLIAQGGPGIYARHASFDHIIRGNVIAVASDRPAVELADADCVGVEITDNQIYGAGGQVVAGPAQPLLEERNTVASFTPDPPRPQPAVPSIFEWQRGEKSEDRDGVR
jgi:hypothetical protein